MKRALGFLVPVLLALGLGLWLSRPAPAPLPPDVVARVDGGAISAHTWFESLAALTVQPRGPRITDAQRDRLLDELIAEELLVQAATEAGLTGSRAARARAALERALPAQPPPSDADLRRFYDDNPNLFARELAYDVAVRWFKGEGSLARAEAALVEVDGGVRLADIAADEPVVRVPVGAVPTQTLVHYLGPSVVDAIEAAEVGEVGKPVAVPGGHWLVEVRHVLAEDRAPLDEVERTVRMLVAREARAAATDAYVARLRSDSEVVVNDEIRLAPVPVEHLRRALSRTR